MLSAPQVLHVSRSIKRRSGSVEESKGGEAPPRRAEDKRSPVLSIGGTTLVPGAWGARLCQPVTPGRGGKWKDRAARWTARRSFRCSEAEGEGFEPPVPQEGTLVFETSAISQALPPFRVSRYRCLQHQQTIFHTCSSFKNTRTQPTWCTFDRRIFEGHAGRAGRLSFRRVGLRLFCR